MGAVKISLQGKIRLWHKPVNYVSRYYSYIRFYTEGKNPGRFPMHDTMPVRCDIDVVVVLVTSSSAWNLISQTNEITDDLLARQSLAPWQKPSELSQLILYKVYTEGGRTMGHPLAWHNASEVWSWWHGTSTPLLVTSFWINVLTQHIY